MAIEIRPVDGTNEYKIYEGDDLIGEIDWSGPAGTRDEYGWEIDEETWGVTIWSLTGSARQWGNVLTTPEAACEEAQVIYEEDFLPERRRAHAPVPGGVKVISSPMGGQKRR
ncbi:hypothetical protein [Streptomyces flavofungini]|uniref:hypothetical protein n=1 Tax=Streptomyces flavofungini TaxID=68200 RepID=UPI0034E00400